ncbi:MAG: YIP1 family protein [Acetobacteraceae bacterium]
MSAGVSVLSGLQGALLLARGRREGVGYVAEDLRSAARSFWAVPVCLPLFFGVLTIGWNDTGWPVNLPHQVVLQLLSFVIGWAGYAVISRPLVAGLGRQSHWPRFIAIWNWCNVVQYALLLVASVPIAAGAPDWFADTAQLVAQGWGLWLEWFAIRLALDINGLRAVLVMLPDFLLGLVLATIAG